MVRLPHLHPADLARVGRRYLELADEQPPSPSALATLAQLEAVLLAHSRELGAYAAARARGTSTSRPGALRAGQPGRRAVASQRGPAS